MSPAKAFINLLLFSTGPNEFFTFRNKYECFIPTQNPKSIDKHLRFEREIPSLSANLSPRKLSFSAFLLQYHQGLGAFTLGVKGFPGCQAVFGGIPPSPPLHIRLFLHIQFYFPFSDFCFFIFIFPLDLNFGFNSKNEPIVTGLVYSFFPQ